RPTRRLISCVRPPMRPLTDSRAPRVPVADGNIAYSAVTQPSPEPTRHRGTPSCTLAAQSTRVRPHSTSTDPAGQSWYPRVMRTSRSSSSLRPSARATGPAYSRRARPQPTPPRSHLVDRARLDEFAGAAERVAGLVEDARPVRPRLQV